MADTPNLWSIEYWNDNTKQVECFSSLDGSWIDAPKKNVIFVYVQRDGSLRGKPGCFYTQILNGHDFYFLKEENNGVVLLGGWSTALEIPPGKYIKWFPDYRWEVIEREIRGRPDEISEKEIKEGVWVKEPWATQLGFSGIPRTIKPCNEKLWSN